MHHSEPQHVGIEDGPGIWIDAREFDRLVAAGCGDQALALCGGELLSDLDDDWVLEARQAHRERVAALLGALGAAAEQAGDLVGRSSTPANGWRWTRSVGGDCARPHRAARPRRRPGVRRRGLSGGAREPSARACVVAPSPETRALVEEIWRSGRHRRSDRRRACRRRCAPGRGPLVGRREALDRLRELWQRVTAGEPAMATIAGEAGGGKTRLISAFAVEARDGGAAVLAGRCFEEASRPTAHSPKRFANTDLVGTDLGLGGAELGRLVPELASEAPRLRRSSRRATRLFEAVAVVLSDAASPRPVVLVDRGPSLGRHATRLMLAHVTRTVDIGAAARRRFVSRGVQRDAGTVGHVAGRLATQRGAG